MSTSRQESSRQNGKLQGLQFTRANAVLLVVVCHAAAILGKAEYFDDSSLRQVIEGGAVGVDLFFVLSGFIIVYVSLANGTLQPRLGVRDYLTKRFIRIVPFLWFSVAFYAVVRFLGAGEFEFGPYMNAALVLPVGELRPNVVWTLRHEILFYVLFGVSFLLRRRVPWLVFGWALAPVAVWVVQLFGAGALPNNEWLQYLLHVQNVEFGLGMALGLAYRRFGGARSLSLPAKIGWPLLVAVTALVFVTRPTEPTLGSTLIAAVAVAAAILLRESQSWVAKIWETMGNASYSIYLTHNTFVLVGAAVWMRLFGDGSYYAACLFIGVASVFGGIALHFAVEKPLLRACNALVRPRRRIRVTPDERTAA